MSRRGLSPGQDSWNLKVGSIKVRERMDLIRDEIERAKGRDVTYTEVLEEMCSRWERGTGEPVIEMHGRWEARP